MNYTHREQESLIRDTLAAGKIAVLYGPRQVGKTTLARHIARGIDTQYLYANCDEPDVRAALTNKTSTELLQFFGTHKTVVIDEAQRVENIGITLKLIADTAPDIHVIATGSSSFELADSINEPLTGRAYYHTIWPLSLAEVASSSIERQRHLGSLLIYGAYPAVALNQVPDKAKYLQEVVNSYLYRDLLNQGVVRSDATVRRLLELLALQLGGEVSLSELSRTMQIDISTVKRLIDLLEKAFIIHRLSPLVRNKRTGVRRPFKLFFTDLGVRNALIGNLNSVDLRTDMGALWENFCVNELRKRTLMQAEPINTYFWRNYAGAEVDYIEERGGTLYPYEFKWRKPTARLPKAFRGEFMHADLQVISRQDIGSLA